MVITTITMVITTITMVIITVIIKVVDLEDVEGFLVLS
jgi:hypothetical protein